MVCFSASHQEQRQWQLPSPGSRWPTRGTNTRKSFQASQAKFEVFIGIRTPRWKNRRKQIVSNPHLCIFFILPQIIGGYRIKQGKKQQLPTQLRGYMSFCQKARPWKRYIIILKIRSSPLLAELHRATEIWNVVIHMQKMHVDLQKILFSTFGALPTWKQILFVLRTLETAFLVLEVYIISFSWYTATLCSPPCT